MTRAQELKRDIRLHERTLENLSGGFHRDNVEASLRKAKLKLKGLSE